MLYLCTHEKLDMGILDSSTVYSDIVTNNSHHWDVINLFRAFY